MITAIRKTFAKGAKESFGIIIVFALVAGLLIVPGALQNIGSSIWALRVNSRSVDYHTYMREFMLQKDRLNSFRSQYGQFADYLLSSMGINPDPKYLALDTLIKEELMNELSDNMNIFIHPEYISEKLYHKEYVQNNLQDIVPLFVFDQDGMINEKTLQKVLSHMQLTTKEFEEKVEAAIARKFLLSLASLTTYTPEFDQEYAKKIRNAERHFSMITIPFDDILTKEKSTPLSNKEISDYFSLHNRLSKKYWIPEKRSGIVWQIDANDYEISVSNDQIEKYYQEHKVKKYIDMPTQVIIKQIIEDETTGSLKDQYDAIVSGEVDLWNDVEPFHRGTHDEMIERQAFTLQKDQVSPVFTTKNGDTVIIKVIDRIKRTYKPLHTVRNEIQTKLLVQLFEKKFIADVKSLIQQESNDSFKAFISSNSITSTNIENITKEQPYGKKLFALKKGAYDIYVEGTTGYIITLESISPSFEPELGLVEDSVKNDIYQERAQKNFKKIIEQQKNTLITDQQSIETESLGWINPNDEEQEKNLQKQGIPTRRLHTMEKQGSVFAHKTSDKGMIFILNEIRPLIEESNKEEAVSDFEKERKMTATQGLVASLYRNAKIETNETILLASEEYSI